MRIFGRPAPGRRRRRGAPLWLYLTALVLVPVLGVVVLTTVIADARTAQADSAARAEAAVRSLAQLDAARSSVEHEIIPVLTLAVIDDPVTGPRLGLPDAVVQSQREQAVAAELAAREATDAALAAVPPGSTGAAAAERAANALTGLRTGVDSAGLALEDVYLEYLDVSNDLMNAQRRAESAASSEQVPATTLRATRDVLIIAELAQAASRQVPLFLGAQLSGGESMGSRLARQTSWLAYTDARSRLDDLSQESLQEAWDAVRTTSRMTGLDDVLATEADPGAQAATPADQLIPLLFRASARDGLLSDLVHTAVDNAQSLAAADRTRATESLYATLRLGMGLLAASLLGAVWLGRRVARSLGLLAGQATEISEGRLVEVEVGGPREVRTVSGALGSAVAGLRRIQDQASAVARGDLDNSLLDEPLPGPLGEVVHASVMEIVHSVRQRELLQDALAHQATHDPLTELPNRAQALALTTAALHRGARSGDMTGLLFVDLDGFKAVNDGHGHAAGDAVLVEVGKRLRSVVRPGDVVCRLGGDEFVVLVEAAQTEQDLMELAERLVAEVSRPMVTGGATVRVGASIGVAVSRDGGTDPDVLFAEADTAAYRAKGHGRGRAEIYDETLRRQLSARSELETAIARGLTDGEMQLYYQPVLDVGSRRLVGYEALLRWQRPAVGLVQPDEFVPVAETSTLICDVDRWVLHEATRQLAEWRAARPAAPGEVEPTVAVNISGRHLADRRVVTDVADALAASGLPASLLVVEVTETVLVDTPLALGHLADLRGLGVGVAIDDFGTGYTSIGQLRHMPVDTLKIDRSFIASTEPAQRALVALMIRAAHTFGLTVVAEGVEDDDQLERLREQGCDQAQGYLLHRPMPAADAGTLLRPRTGAST